MPSEARALKRERPIDEFTALSAPSSLPPSPPLPTLLYLYTHAFVVLEGATEVPAKEARGAHAILDACDRRPLYYKRGSLHSLSPSLSLRLPYSTFLASRPNVRLFLSLPLSPFLLRQKEQKGHAGSVVVVLVTAKRGGRGTEQARAHARAAVDLVVKPSEWPAPVF